MAANGKTFQKGILVLLHHTKDSKLIYVFQMHKSIFLIENGMNSIDILRTRSHKILLMHYRQYLIKYLSYLLQFLKSLVYLLYKNLITSF